MKLIIYAGDKDATNAQDAAIANAYGNKFIIPLDFEMLDSAMPCYQSGLGNKLCCEIMFNDHNQVVMSGKADAKYETSDMCLEYEIVTHPNLARRVSNEYHEYMALSYDRIHNHSRSIVDKSDTIWNWAFNTPCKPLKGILISKKKSRSLETQARFTILR